MPEQAAEEPLAANHPNRGAGKGRRRSAVSCRRQRAIAERLMRAPAVVDARVLGEDVPQGGAGSEAGLPELLTHYPTALDRQIGE